MKSNYNQTLERLDGTAVEFPDTLQYPNQVQVWAEQQVKLVEEPMVYVYTWKHDKGEVVKKFYNDACWSIPSMAIEMFDDLCKNHDWYYDYSDDHRVWQRGREAESRLRARYTSLLKTDIKTSVEAIWQTYAKA